MVRWYILEPSPAAITTGVNSAGHCFPAPRIAWKSFIERFSNKLPKGMFGIRSEDTVVVVWLFLRDLQLTSLYTWIYFYYYLKVIDRCLLTHFMLKKNVISSVFWLKSKYLKNFDILAQCFVNLSFVAKIVPRATSNSKVGSYLSRVLFNFGSKRAEIVRILLK